MSLEYIDNVVNFINNTKGYLEDFEIKFLIDEYKAFNSIEVNRLVNEYRQVMNELVSVEDTEGVVNIITEIKKILKENGK